MQNFDTIIIASVDWLSWISRTGSSLRESSNRLGLRSPLTASQQHVCAGAEAAEGVEAVEEGAEAGRSTAEEATAAIATCRTEEVSMKMGIAAADGVGAEAEAEAGSRTARMLVEAAGVL